MITGICAKNLAVGDIPTTDEVRRIINECGIRAAVGAVDRRYRHRLARQRTAGLRWDDVDLKVGELHVRPRADAYRAIGAPKSHSSSRTIPLGPMVVNTLRGVEAGFRGRSGAPVAPWRCRALSEHRARTRRGHDRRWRGRSRWRAEIQPPACLPSLLRLVVHQPAAGWRARITSQSGASPARPQPWTPTVTYSPVAMTSANWQRPRRHSSAESVVTPCRAREKAL
jgi:hypothetical protein